MNEESVGVHVLRICSISVRSKVAAVQNESRRELIEKEARTNWSIRTGLLVSKLRSEGRGLTGLDSADHALEAPERIFSESTLISAYPSTRLGAM